MVLDRGVSGLRIVSSRVTVAHRSSRKESTSIRDRAPNARFMADRHAVACSRTGDRSPPGRTADRLPQPTAGTLLGDPAGWPAKRRLSCTGCGTRRGVAHRNACETELAVHRPQRHDGHLCLPGGRERRLPHGPRWRYAAVAPRSSGHAHRYNREPVPPHFSAFGADTDLPLTAGRATAVMVVVTSCLLTIRCATRCAPKRGRPRWDSNPRRDKPNGFAIRPLGPLGHAAGLLLSHFILQHTGNSGYFGEEADVLAQCRFAISSANSLLKCAGSSANRIAIRRSWCVSWITQSRVVRGRCGEMSR